MKHLCVFLLSFLLASCASNTARDSIDYKSRDFKSQQNERIIYRDLTVPKSAARSLSAPSSKEAAIVSVPHVTDPFYIPFYNESSVLPKTASWGSHRDSLAPPKGVLVYVTGEHNGRYLLSLTPFDFDKEAEYEQPQLASTGT